MIYPGQRLRFYFNPRSPCGERPMSILLSHPRKVFQSTLPVRGATYAAGGRIVDTAFQSTLPVRGATHDPGGKQFPVGISIHAPRAGSDAIINRKSVQIRISIHAPRAGSDFFCKFHRLILQDFNPRSPCGERQHSEVPSCRLSDFNPRSPCGERP